MICGLPCVYAAYFLGRAIFVRALSAIALPLLVILHPQLVFTDSYTNTDGVLISLSAIATCLAVLAMKRGMRSTDALWLGFLLGWACLAKPNALTLLPAFIYAIYSSCSKQQFGQAKTVKLMVAFLSSLGATCDFWYVRNILEFKGDFLGTRTMNLIWQTNLVHVDGKAIMPGPRFPAVGWWRYVFFDFWGFFGFMNRYLWRPFYIAYLVICLVAIAAKCKVVVQSLLCKKRRLVESETEIWCFFAISVLVNMLGVVYVSLAEISGPHGRYLFTCELPLLCFLLAGLDKLGRPLSTIFVVLLIALCAASTLWGWTVFYSMHNWTQ